jgi:hypothetical protein
MSFRRGSEQHPAGTLAGPVLCEEPDELRGGQCLAQADRRAKAGPRTGRAQVAEAQLAALAKWGAIPATDRYGDLKKIKQRALVVNGKNDIMVPTINVPLSLDWSETVAVGVEFRPASGEHVA